MQFSENWLRSLVEIDLDRASLAHQLTMAGLEVEDVTVLGEHFDGLVVAEIIEANQHPDADRLRICQVNIGTDSPLTIVCGAPNARPGLKAPLATIGTRMPGGMRIKAAKLRGVGSQGMLCSAKELGLDEDASGLLELPDDAPPGVALADYLGLPDASFDVGLTPNRPDCLGMYGLARDVAAVLDVGFHVPQTQPVAIEIDTRRVIQLQAPEACPRYSGRVIESIDTNVPTPLWMSERLHRAGLRCKNIIVDVTNYVMLETGQPLHAFDQDKLVGDIHVRRAEPYEKLTLLNDVEVSLDADFLVIADDRQAQAIGGIMGGKPACVSDTTVNIFLESAHFSPYAIMGKARKLGLHTDASHRLERGVDPALPLPALERASYLLTTLAGGKAGPVTLGENPAYFSAPTSIQLRHKRLQRVLGIDVDRKRVTHILECLGMQVNEQDDGWQVVAPSWRFDIALEVDLIEEIARIVGYETIPTTSPSGRLSIEPIPEARQSTLAIAHQLVAREYRETINMAFLDRSTLDSWHMHKATIELANPLTQELAIMRPSLLPGIVKALQHNMQRQQTRVRLFERGHVFAHAETDNSIMEQERIAWVATGDTFKQQWGEAARAMDFYDIRGDLDALFEHTGRKHDYVLTDEAVPAWLHPGRAACIHAKQQLVGYIGMLHPSLLQALGIKQDVYVAEVDYAGIAGLRMPAASHIGRFPAIRRDLAIELPLAINWASVSHCVTRAAGSHLKHVYLFDKYTGEGVACGYKSLAMGLLLQDDMRTLTDDDANTCVDQVVAALARDCQARLRG